MNPVTILLAGGWKYLAALVLLVGGYAWLTTAAWNRGVAHERGVWTERQAHDDAAAVVAGTARQAARDTALAAAAARARRYSEQRAPLSQEVIRYVATPAAAVRCPDADGVRVGTAAIDAANTALAAR